MEVIQSGCPPRAAFEMLERYHRKLSRMACPAIALRWRILKGEWGRKAPDLLDAAKRAAKSHF